MKNTVVKHRSKNKKKYEEWKKQMAKLRCNTEPPQIRRRQKHFNQNYSDKLKCFICKANHKVWECEKRFHDSSSDAQDS